MTTHRQRLKELQQQAKYLAERIERLEDQINNAHPPTGLLGRWATHPEYGDVLIADEKSDNGLIQIVYLSSISRGGTYSRTVNIDDLEFPDQTTRPEDVPVGAAWLVDAVDADDADNSRTHTPAVKKSKDFWVTGLGSERGTSIWRDSEITLITPLIPAHPQDKPETVTTEDEYEQLPSGSIVAKPEGKPWTRLKHIWAEGDDIMDSFELAGITRHILRRGWGE